MKRKYISPFIEKETLSIENSISTGSRVNFGGSTNSQPDIEDSTIEESHFDLEF